jgi:hypothetical protein
MIWQYYTVYRKKSGNNRKTFGYHYSDNFDLYEKDEVLGRQVNMENGLFVISATSSITNVKY